MSVRSICYFCGDRTEVDYRTFSRNNGKLVSKPICHKCWNYIMNDFFIPEVGDDDE